MKMLYGFYFSISRYLEIGKTDPTQSIGKFTIHNFFLPQAWLIHKGSSLPFAGGSHRTETKNKNSITHTFTLHIHSDTPWYSRRGATTGVSVKLTQYSKNTDIIYSKIKQNQPQPDERGRCNSVRRVQEPGVVVMQSDVLSSINSGYGIGHAHAT